MTASRPVVFISSTIYDMRDLRSAVRFWLEEAGLEVWMSEYNDMVKPAGANAFEACFESIRQADFYVLLVGEKKGSTYSQADGASVTQQEYREAYAAFQAQGRPIPIMFVRAEVRDRIDGWVRGGRGGQSPFQDAAFIASFIEEVEQKQATTAAIAGIGPYPLGNWLARFHDFREIIDGLRVALNLRVDVPLQRVLAAIRLDLEPTIAAFVGKDYYRPKGTATEARLREVVDGIPEPERTAQHARLDQLLEEMELKVPLPPHRVFDVLVQDCPLPKRARDEPPVMLTAEQARLLRRHLFLGVPAPDSIRIRAVQDAVTAGSLLAYNPATRTLEETPLSLAAEELLEQARHYEWAHGMVERHRWQLFEALRGRRPYALPYIQAVDIWSLHHAQTNFFRRAAALYAHLIGRKPGPEPEDLLPHSPFGAETDEQIKRERTNRADVREWSDWAEFWKL